MDSSVVIPKLLIALALLSGGLITAYLLRSLTERLLALLRDISGKAQLSEQSPMARRMVNQTQPISRLVFWLVIFLSVGFTLSLLEVQLFNHWLAAMMAYLPKLTVGILVILAGIVLGQVARGMVMQTARFADVAASAWLGRICQWLIIGASGLIGIAQWGIDISLLNYIAITTFAVLAGAFGLGLALGAPTHVSNFMSARYIQRAFLQGDHIRIGEYEGVIRAITSYAVILETDTEQIHLPAKLLVESACARIPAEDSQQGAPNERS